MTEEPHIEVRQQADVAHMTLPSVIELREAAMLHDALSRAAAAATQVLLDASQVDRVSTPAAQLLLATHKSLAAKGGGLAVSRPSAALTDAFSDLGLEESFRPWCEAGEALAADDSGPAASS